MADKVIAVSAYEFKSRCRSLLDRIAAGEVSRVVVSKRGVAIAEVVPPRRKVPDPWGALRGTVTVAPGVDLTEPVLSEDGFDAAKGILDR